MVYVGKGLWLFRTGDFSLRTALPVVCRVSVHADSLFREWEWPRHPHLPQLIWTNCCTVTVYNSMELPDGVVQLTLDSHLILIRLQVTATPGVQNISMMSLRTGWQWCLHKASQQSTHTHIHTHPRVLLLPWLFLQSGTNIMSCPQLLTTPINKRQHGFNQSYLLL